MKASRVSLILLALALLLTAPLPVYGETEPNNNKAEADMLTSGVPMPGQMMSQSDQDWFCVVTSGPEDIPVTFTHDYVGYQFNQYLSAECGYNYDLVRSDLQGRGYQRNQIFVGVGVMY